MPYIHRHVVCVCVRVGVCVCVCLSVCLSVSKQKGKPSCSTGGGLGDRMAIHSQRHGVCACVRACVRACVCVCGAKGRTILFHRGGGGGFSFRPGPHAQLKNHKTAGVGGGDAAGSRAQNRGGGGRGCRRSRGISCSTGGAGRIHHDVHYLLKYKST